MGEPGNGKPDIRLIAVNDKGLYLEAVGTVDGVEVSAPFLAMLDPGGQPIKDGGVLDLLRQAKEELDRPGPVEAKAAKGDKVGFTKPITVPIAADYSARKAEVAEVKKRWDALLRKERGYL
jgi:hypothetical protein